MTVLNDAFRGWLKAWRQPAAYFGAAIIAAVWMSFGYHLSVERERLVLSAVINSNNLARVFEEHIVRTLKETDRTLLLLRTAFLADTSKTDFDDWLAHPAVRGNMVAQIGIIGVDGIIKATSFGSVTSRVDVNDRPYFRAQLDAAKDELFIGEAVVGRVSGTRVIQLSRGIRDADGVLLGVMLATLDVQYLAKFYESIDVGIDGAIVLAGLDGIIRAAAGFKKDVVGNSLKQSQLFKKILIAKTGSFLTVGGQDSVKRFVSYRVVREYPLVVYVGEAEREVLAPYWQNQRWYYGIASIATMLIVIVVIFSIRNGNRLNSAQAAIRESEARARRKSQELEVTLEHMDQGIVMVDANRDIVVANRRLVQLLGLPEEMLARIQSGIKIDEIISLLWATGEYGKEGDAVDPKIREMLLAGGMALHVPVFERTRPNGVTLEIRSNALPEGGIVRTFTDVSERKNKELQIGYMARHDSMTGLANRALVNERLEQALARMRRQKEGFAVLCLDLDRFKAVNDAHGHAVGDALLQSVAARLLACVRETDTVGRLGGDEFMLLLAATAREADAEVLAKRVLRSIGAPYDLDGVCAEIGTSVGIAMAPRDGETAAELLRNGDAALYRAKSRDGNVHHFFGQDGPDRSVTERSVSIVP